MNGSTFQRGLSLPKAGLSFKQTPLWLRQAQPPLVLKKITFALNYLQRNST